MLGFTQYGSRLFSIDASSDPTKFQDDWPSGSPLIGAWSLAFAPEARGAAAAAPQGREIGPQRQASHLLPKT